MWSEEEFTIFQMKLVELGQENFQLKEQIATVKKENADFDDLTAELQKLEQQRDESRERHQQSVAVLREEFTKLQKEQKEQDEEALKRANERVSELTRELAEVNQSIKSKEEEADALKIKIKKHDGELQQKTQYLHQLQHQEQMYRPMINFLRTSRSIPMYIEDLSVRNDMLREKKRVGQEKLDQMCKKLSDLQKLNTGIKDKAAAKNEEIKNNQSTAAATLQRKQMAEKEIDRTQKALDEANQRLSVAKEQTEEIISQRREMEAKAEAQGKEITDKITDYNERKKLLEQQIEEIKNSRNTEIEQYSEKISQLRKKLTYIKENDNDPDVPRVDTDLKKQIRNVKAQMADLETAIQKAERDKKELAIQISQKDFELQAISLKMPPTQKILEDPGFQTKQLLLQEMVLQNASLRKKFAEMTEKITSLKQENAEIRRQLGSI